MIIDFHTHVFPDRIAQKTIELLSAKGGIPAHSNGTVTGLLEHMEKAGVELSVTLPVLTNPQSFEKVNQYAYELNQVYSQGSRRLISFGAIHPLCEDIDKKMKALKDMGFLGVKLHPDYQECFITHEGYIRILQCAKEYDLIALTHAGFDVGYPDAPIRCTPALAREVIDKVKPSRFVLAHCGSTRLLDEALTMLCGQDVYLDTAYVLQYMGKERFLEILRRHGEDKILFASDSPWSSIENDVNTLRSFGLGKETENKIFSENTRALLGI